MYTIHASNRVCCSGAVWQSGVWILQPSPRPQSIEAFHSRVASQPGSCEVKIFSRLWGSLRKGTFCILMSSLVKRASIPVIQTAWYCKHTLTPMYVLKHFLTPVYHARTREKLIGDLAYAIHWLDQATSDDLSIIAWCTRLRLLDVASGLFQKTSSSKQTLLISLIHLENYSYIVTTIHRNITISITILCVWTTSSYLQPSSRAKCQNASHHYPFQKAKAKRDVAIRRPDK